MNNDLLPRTRAFALAVIRFCTTLPNRPEGWVLGKQLLKSGTSIGANYHEAQRARTTAEFISKVQISQQEIEETLYWLQLLIDAEIGKRSDCEQLYAECNELRLIFATIAKNAGRRKPVG